MLIGDAADISKALKLSKNQPVLTGTKASNMRKKVKKSEEVGTRVVPIPDKLLPVMTALCADKNNDDILFPKADGKYATKVACREWWKSIKRQCHISVGATLYNNAVLVETSKFDDKVSPHYLRHTYATDLHAAGVDERSRKELLGHATNDVTDTYTAMSDEAFDRALCLINTYLDNEKWKPKEEKGDKSGTNKNSDKV